MYRIRKSYVYLLCRALGTVYKSSETFHDYVDDTEFVEIQSVYEWLANLAVTSCDPDLGLRAYRNMHPAMLGALGYAVMSCATLGGALERLVNYYPLISSGSLLKLELHDHIVKIVSIEVTKKVPRVFIDAGFSILLALIRWLVPHYYVVPLGVELVYAPPGERGELEEVFGRNLNFSAGHNVLVFPREICNYPLITASPKLDRLHAEFLKVQLESSPTGFASSKIRRAVAQSLALGVTPTLDSIADALKVSKRTLQYSLRNEGLSFSMVYNDVRQALAHDYLRHSVYSIKYISATLGFSDQSSFYKASLRWFGMTPQNYRDLS